MWLLIKPFMNGSKISVLGLFEQKIRPLRRRGRSNAGNVWRIWDNAASFNTERGSLPNWMFGIARNLSIDIVRRGQKIKMQALPDMHHDHIEVSRHYQDDHDVADAALLLLRHKQVHTALTELPAEQRDVVEWILLPGQNPPSNCSGNGYSFWHN